MLVTAFTSNLLWNMTIQALQTGLNLGTGFAGVVRDVAQILPTVISSTWLNWCILSESIVACPSYMDLSFSFVFANSEPFTYSFVVFVCLSLTHTLFPIHLQELP